MRLSAVPQFTTLNSSTERRTISSTSEYLRASRSSALICTCLWLMATRERDARSRATQTKAALRAQGRAAIIAVPRRRRRARRFWVKRARTSTAFCAPSWAQRSPGRTVFRNCETYSRARWSYNNASLLLFSNASVVSHPPFRGESAMICSGSAAPSIARRSCGRGQQVDEVRHFPGARALLRRRVSQAPRSLAGGARARARCRRACSRVSGLDALRAAPGLCPRRRAPVLPATGTRAGARKARRTSTPSRTECAAARSGRARIRRRGPSRKKRSRAVPGDDVVCPPTALVKCASPSSTSACFVRVSIERVHLRFASRTEEEFFSRFFFRKGASSSRVARRHEERPSCPDCRSVPESVPGGSSRLPADNQPIGRAYELERRGRAPGPRKRSWPPATKIRRTR